MMIETVMYGMIPSAKIGELGERLAAEQLQEGEHAAGLGLRLERVDRVLVDARRGDVGAEAVQRQHPDREQHLASELPDSEDVAQELDHLGLPTAGAPWSGPDGPPTRGPTDGNGTAAVDSCRLADIVRQRLV